jgi:hypothetical protein
MRRRAHLNLILILLSLNLLNSRMRLNRVLLEPTRRLLLLLRGALLLLLRRTEETIEATRRGIVRQNEDDS